MDISAGPLLRALLLTSGQPRLFLAIHHLVMDGVSLGASWLEDLTTSL